MLKEISAVSYWSQKQAMSPKWFQLMSFFYQSLSAQKKAGIFYLEQSVLVPDRVREGARSGAEGLFWGFGCALFSYPHGRESANAEFTFSASIIPSYLIYKIELQFSPN